MTRNSATQPREASTASVAVTVEALVEATVEASFDVVTPIQLSDMFTGYGPLPAVVGVEDQSGPWDHVGVHRKPQLSDGTEAFEQITGYDPPRFFAYEVSGFTNVLNRFVFGARGSWAFTAQGDHTEIRWTYAFRPRPGRRQAVRFFIAPLWRRYMGRALAIAVRHVERGGAKVTTSNG